MRDCILTMDAGTTGLKCTLFQADGKAIRVAVAPYPVELPHPGWAQQPATWFINAAIEGAKCVLEGEDASRVAVIGLSGTMNGCIPINEDGEALYPNIIHSDTRSEPQLERLRAVVDEKTYYAHTGNRMDVHYTLPKILWLRENYENAYQDARWFVNTKDILYGWLTGRHGVTDFSDASLTGALDIHHGVWDAEILRGVGVDPNKMPTILPSHDVAGRLTTDAAQALGLPAGMPVSVGAGDGICAAHGAGIHSPGDAYINIGSSAWLGTLWENPVIDEQMRFFHFLDMDGKHSHLCATVQCAAASLDWVVENLLTGGQTPDAAVFEEMETLAESVPAGAEGVFFLPTLMGERTPWWDANARGTLIGMSLYHRRAHVARAAYEGVAQALHLCDSALRENGLSYDSIALVGGGARSGIWPQMLADVFDLPTFVHSHSRQATSLGAAMAAGVGVGLFRDYAEAAQMASMGGEYIPDAMLVPIYQRHYAVYRKLYGQIRQAYEAIGAYQAGQG